MIRVTVAKDDSGNVSIWMGGMEYEVEKGDEGEWYCDYNLIVTEDGWTRDNDLTRRFPSTVDLIRKIPNGEKVEWILELKEVPNE